MILQKKEQKKLKAHKTKQAKEREAKEVKEYRSVFNDYEFDNVPTRKDKAKDQITAPSDFKSSCSLS